jgi:hypothetical protein
MRSLSYSPAKEEQNVTVKQEVEGEAVAVKEEEEDVSVKEEEEDAFRVKKEEDVTVKEEEGKEEDAVFGVEKEGEITVTLKDEEVEVGDLINTSKYRLKFVVNFGYSQLAGQYLFNGGPWEDD